MHQESVLVPSVQCLLYLLHINHDSGHKNKHASLFLHSYIIFFFHTEDPKKIVCFMHWKNDIIPIEAVYHTLINLLYKFGLFS